jgi:hypothetical protein
MNTILNILNYSKLLNFGEEKNKVSFLFGKFFLVFVWKGTFSNGKEIISVFEFKRKKKKNVWKTLEFSTGLTKSYKMPFSFKFKMFIWFFFCFVLNTLSKKKMNFSGSNYFKSTCFISIQFVTKCFILHICFSQYFASFNSVKLKCPPHSEGKNKPKKTLLIKLFIFSFCIEEIAFLTLYKSHSKTTISLSRLAA